MWCMQQVFRKNWFVREAIKKTNQVKLGTFSQQGGWVAEDQSHIPNCIWDLRIYIGRIWPSEFHSHMCPNFHRVGGWQATWDNVPSLTWSFLMASLKETHEKWSCIKGMIEYWLKVYNLYFFYNQWKVWKPFGLFWHRHNLMRVNG